MRKIIKNIPVFFLWLASLAIVAHMIIPHDHHLSESAGGQEDFCPASNNQSGHKTGFPIHCHALHDLTSEKASIYKIISLVQNQFFISDNFPQLSDCPLLLSELSFTDLKEPFSDSYLLEYSSLRAPPSIC